MSEGGGRNGDNLMVTAGVGLPWGSQGKAGGVWLCASRCPVSERGPRLPLRLGGVWGTQAGRWCGSFCELRVEFGV